MNVAEALAEMRQRGVLLFIGASVDDGSPTLRWRAGPGIVTAKTVTYITAHSAELLALLQAEAAVDATQLRREALRSFFDVDLEDEDEELFPPEPDDETAEPEPSIGDWMTDVAPAEPADVIRCHSCGLVRNAELDRCPMCDATDDLPAGCLSPLMCRVVGGCGRAACAAPAAIG